MNKFSAKLLLTAVFIARGTSFLFSKSLMTGLSPMNILSLRFMLAFVILLLVFCKKVFHCSKESLKGGLILGVLYFVTMVFEMYGLRLIDSGVSALIENMAIVLVPVYVAIFTRSFPSKKTILCALMAVAGVGFLSLTQVQNAGAWTGIILIILAALTYAGAIIMTARVSQTGDPVTIGVIQIGTMGVLSTIVSLSTGSFALPQTQNQYLMLLMLAVVCSCFGFVFQPVGQKYVDADTAAVFTVVNPLTASVMGILLAGESFSVLKAIGYVLILGALLIYNLRASHKEAL